MSSRSIDLEIENILLTNRRQRNAAEVTILAHQLKNSLEIDRQHFVEGSKSWNPNEVCKVIRSTSKEHSIPAKMMYDGKQVNELQNKSEAFNDQFAPAFSPDGTVLEGPKTSSN